MRIGKIVKHAQQFFVFGARFFPFAGVEEGLGALFLKLDARIGIFLAENFRYLRQRGSGSFAFVGEGILVEKNLIILGGARSLTSGFVSLGALEEQRGFHGD